MARAAATAPRPAPARRLVGRAPTRRAPARRAPARRPVVVPTGARLLDSLLQGRAWIALVGILLVGIVFFNVDLLRVNRQIAHTSERTTVVKRHNSRMRLELARLYSIERIQGSAAERGLSLPAPGQVRFLRARPALDATRAAERLGRRGSAVATGSAGGTAAGGAGSTATQQSPAQQPAQEPPQQQTAPLQAAPQAVQPQQSAPAQTGVAQPGATGTTP